MKPLYIFILISISACSSLQYTSSTKKVLPELGTIGVYHDYVLSNNYESKSILSLSDPIRLQWSKVNISERKIFQKKDSLSPRVDSTLIVVEILDKLSIVQQINSDKIGLEFLKKAEDCSLVTQTTLHFPKNIINSFEDSDEVYLVQNKTKTLSIELRKNNKKFRTLEFAEGSITDVKTSTFCWGQNKRREIVIFDLVPPSMACSANTYKTARKAKKKNEINFFK